VDYEDAINGRFARLVALIVCATLLVLAVGPALLRLASRWH
jgi:hypothetical protein